jgi:hypothetical protein
MSNESRDAINALCARHDVTMSAVFVPQSFSRHSAEKTHTLNWRVTFASPKRGAFALDYSQGIGHVPGNQIARTLYDEQIMGKPWETGRYNPNPRGSFAVTRPLPAPSAADILYCIVLDDTCEHSSFEDWASDMGYDTDSRKAEQIYNQCREQSRDARRILGRELMTEAAELLKDY